MKFTNVILTFHKCFLTCGNSFHRTCCLISLFIEMWSVFFTIVFYPTCSVWYRHYKTESGAHFDPDLYSLDRQHYDCWNLCMVVTETAANISRSPTSNAALSHTQGKWPKMQDHRLKACCFHWCCRPNQSTIINDFRQWSLARASAANVIWINGTASKGTKISASDSKGSFVSLNLELRAQKIDQHIYFIHIHEKHPWYKLTYDRACS